MRRTARSMTAGTIAAVALLGATSVAATTVPDSGPATTAAASTGTDTAGDYHVRIVRDAAGVPHIIADDYGSLGYGQGLAIAEDRACTVLDQVIKVRGERAAYLGAGADDEYVTSDFAYRHLGIWEQAPTRWANQPAEVTAIVTGVVDGINDQLAAGGGTVSCGNFDWTGEISEQDYYAVVSDILLLASSQNLLTEIGSTQPPAAADAAASDAPATTAAEAASGLAATVRPHDNIGSNGWAFGAERSTTGGGMLLGNPHFPWEGELRFWENHLIIPGELNVYGVSLTGLAGVQIGFNENVAWTHTVSSGHRFNLYRYDLDPADPTVYLVDGEPQQMEATEYTVEVRNDDGTSSEVTRTLYRTKHGPVVAVDPLGWTPEMAIAIADANLEIDRVLQQYLGMDRSASLEEFQQVHAEAQGIPWVNTMATSADGRAWYTDGSATPNISPEALAAWQEEREAGGLAGLAYDMADIIMLNGSDSMFDWVDDPAAPAPGLVPASAQPSLERTDFVFNANDSYWLTNPDELLSGFTILQGEEGVAPTARTRTNLALITETTEPWDLHDVQDALLSNRTELSTHLLAPLVEACTATPNVMMEDGSTFDVTEACTALAGWDGTFSVDSRGAILFREWISRYDWEEFSDAGRLWSDSFDPANPTATPAVPVADTTQWLQQLAVTTQFLNFLGIPLDAPLGDYQFEIRSGQRLPIPGGNGFEGVANVVSSGTRSSSTLDVADAGELVDGEVSALYQLPDGSFGYPIEYGGSFIYTIQYGPDGPNAEAILTYGNPNDPADPAYSAGLEAFSTGTWRPLTFGEDAVEALFADPALTTTVVGDPG